MEHIIAYNPYKNGNKGSVSSQPLSVYDKTIAYPWMADLVAAIRGGNDELKKQLPFRCAHYYQFRDKCRARKLPLPDHHRCGRQGICGQGDREGTGAELQRHHLERSPAAPGVLSPQEVAHRHPHARRHDYRGDATSLLRGTGRALRRELHHARTHALHHRQGVGNLSLAPLVRGAATGRAEEAQTSIPGPWACHRRTNPARHPA